MTIQERLVPGRYKLTVADYMLLDEAGAFGDAKTELIDGEVIVLSPQYRPHAYVKDELAFLLRVTLEQAWPLFQVVTEASVALASSEMPMPDIIVTSERRGSGPVPGTTIALIVEVSSSTRRIDIGRKAMLYAANGIPEYWVADVEKRVVRRHVAAPAEPSASLTGHYVEQSPVVFGEVLASITLAGLLIDTSSL